MKVLSTYLILLILMSSYASAKTGVDLDGRRLLGPIHTMETEIIEISIVDGKEVVSRRRSHRRVVYDRSGNLLEGTSFNEDGSIENHSVQIIGANGLLAGWETYEPIPNGKDLRMTSNAEFLYDKKGNQIEGRVYRHGILSHLTQASYDAAGRLIEEVKGMNHGKGILFERTKASYDTAGRLVEEVKFTEDGKWKQTTKPEYDSGGRLLKTTTEVDTNGRIGQTEQSYDGAGNVTRIKILSPDGQDDSEEVFSYDAKGREIEPNSEDTISKGKFLTSYDAKGRVIKKVTQFGYKRPDIHRTHDPEPGIVEYSYNYKDQAVEQTVYSPEGTLLHKWVNDYDGDGRLRSQSYGDGDTANKTTYEYDKFGNRTKRATPYADWGGKPIIYVEQAKITYYDGK